MSKKIGFLQRWMFIIDKINAHPYITKEELERDLQEELPNYDGATKIGTKSRTLERDMAEIRNSPYMDISIEYCRQRKGYFIPKNEKSLSKLERLFELSSLLSFRTLKDIVFVQNRNSKGLEYRFGLISAIQKSVEINIEYDKYENPSERKERRLQPYALREFKYRWYLLAKEVGGSSKNKGTIKTWGLDRIEKLTITNRPFEKDPDIDLNVKFEHCFGIYSNKELQAEKVVLSFSTLSGKYIKSCPLHETQKTLIDNNQEFRIELTVKLTRDFLLELLSQVGMRVIAPQRLKDKLIDLHQKAIDLLQHPT